MFGRGRLKELGISKSKLIRLVSKETGCSKKAAENRINAILDAGGSLKYCLDNGMFEMKAGELRRFFENYGLREYVNLVSESEGVKAIEVYNQMKRAKADFGISNSYFARFNLFNADDDALEKHAQGGKKSAIAKIARVLGVSLSEAEDEARRIQEKFSITPSSYYNRRYYDKTDEEIEQLLADEKAHKQQDIREISEATGWTEEEVKEDMNRRYRKFGIRKDEYSMFKCYELDDDTLAKYGCYRDSYTLNHLYNSKKDMKLLHRKPNFDKRFKEFTKRKHWVNRNTTFEEFEAFAKDTPEAFCKPVDGSFGQAVECVSFEDGVDFHDLYDELMSKPRLLFEERVIQHKDLNAFYDKSVNTLRLFTILKDGEFHPFAAFIRFGANGSLADNVAAGGVGCGVDVNTGTICTDAMDHDGNFLEAHPNSGKVFNGFKLPHWDKALDLAERALREVPGLNYIGWDIAIREDDVVLIEGNHHPDIGICQAFFTYSHTPIKPWYEKFLKK